MGRRGSREPMPRSRPPELKWVAGWFYWLNAVQPYSSGSWKYLATLKQWVDGGMDPASAHALPLG
eukprot:11075572-Alexandrium_andersonii.AAC.1